MKTSEVIEFFGSQRQAAKAKVYAVCLEKAPPLECRETLKDLY